MDINYNSASALQSFLAENGLGMRKKFGQNFLINPGIRDALVCALNAPEGEGVWEIGPGLGAMTRLLLERGLHVRAFEIDPGFARILRELFAAHAHFTLVEGDVLKTWPEPKVPPEPETESPSESFPYLLGNLPYNIAAATLADFIEKGRLFKRMVVTVQREVARRMIAAPDSADYSSFSVLCASVYRVKPLMVIKSASFYPRPHVDSQAVLLELREDAGERKPACFYQLVRGLFAARRKTIKNNLMNFCTVRGKPSAMAATALEQCAINGGKRAENLTLQDFWGLAKTMEDMGI